MVVIFCEDFSYIVGIVIEIVICIFSDFKDEGLIEFLGSKIIVF